jgi:hypothetical protein
MWVAVSRSTSPKHLGLKLLALCAPPLVPFVISRGAPRQATWETSVSKGRNWTRKCSVNFACDSNFHVNLRGLLHAANLRHGTDGFTSPPKEGMLWIFSPENPTASARFEPTILGACMLTARPPKPLSSGYTSNITKRSILNTCGWTLILCY